MKIIYKYPVELTDLFVLNMPRGAQVLSVGVQHDEPQMWALVDPAAPTEKRHFRLAGTGHPIEPQHLHGRFVGTIQLHCGSLIFHLFDLHEG